MLPLRHVTTSGNAALSTAVPPLSMPSRSRNSKVSPLVAAIWTSASLAWSTGSSHPVADTDASLFVKMSARPSRAAAVAAVEKSRARERASSEAMERLNETDPLTDGEVESSEGTEDKESEEEDSEEEEGSDDDEEEEDDLEIDDVSDDGSVAEVGLGEEEVGVGADEVPAAVPPADGDENAIAGAGNFAEALSVLLSSAASAIKRDGKLTVAAAASVVSRAWDLAGGLVPDQGFLQGLLPERVEHRILEEETITDGMREQMDQYVPGRAGRESAMAGGGEHVRAAGFSSSNSNVVDDDDSENEDNEEDEDQASKREMMKVVEDGTLVLDENTEWNDKKEAAHRG